MHRVSPSVACHANAQVCSRCVACRDDAVNVYETRTSARRDDMVVEGSQEYARPCGAMASDGHVCMIARPHVRTSCGCPIMPWTDYMRVYDIAHGKQHPVMMHACVRHTTSVNIECNDMMNNPRPKVASEIWSVIWPQNSVHLSMHANAFSISGRTCGERERG